MTQQTTETPRQEDLLWASRGCALPTEAHQGEDASHRVDLSRVSCSLAVH